MSYTYSKEDNEHVIWTLKNLEEKIGSTSMEIVETIAKKLDLKPERIEPLVQSALNRCVVFGEVKKKGTHFRLELLEQYTEYLQRQPSHEALGSKYSQKDLKREVTRPATTTRKSSRKCRNCKGREMCQVPRQSHRKKGFLTQK